MLTDADLNRLCCEVAMDNRSATVDRVLREAYRLALEDCAIVMSRCASAQPTKTDSRDFFRWLLEKTDALKRPSDAE